MNNYELNAFRKAAPEKKIFLLPTNKQRYYFLKCAFSGFLIPSAYSYIISCIIYWPALTAKLCYFIIAILYLDP